MTGGGGLEFWIHLGAEENDQTGHAAGAESLSTPPSYQTESSESTMRRMSLVQCQQVFLPLSNASELPYHGHKLEVRRKKHGR